MKLVEDIDKAWSWLTMQIGACLVVLPLAWATLTAAQQDAILAMLPYSDHIKGWQALMALGAAIMAARVIKQGSTKK